MARGEKCATNPCNKSRRLRESVPWTTLQLQTLRENASLGAAGLAAILGRSPSSVRAQAARFRISLRTPKCRRGLILGPASWRQPAGDDARGHRRRRGERHRCRCAHGTRPRGGTLPLLRRAADHRREFGELPYLPSSPTHLGACGRARRARRAARAVDRPPGAAPGAAAGRSFVFSLVPSPAQRRAASPALRDIGRVTRVRPS